MRSRNIADEFEHYRKQYIYQIGDTRDKWNQPRRNAQVGDLVLLCEKNLPRLQWSTGIIVETIPGRDGLVRKVVVQPHRRRGQKSMPRQLTRAIQYLVLLKEVHTTPEKSGLDIEKLDSIQEQQQVLTTMKPEIVDPELHLPDLFGEKERRYRMS